jgi:magnesium chelatase family protein
LSELRLRSSSTAEGNLHIEKVRASREEPRQSARAHDRVLRVARTIADLDGGGPIRPAHVVEAISYPSLDRKLWAR